MTSHTTYNKLADLLEVDHGISILEELTGQNLTRKGQSVRLFDQTTKSAEAYYPADENGKPYVQNFQEGKRWYPISAWAEAHELDWKAAVKDLAKQYIGSDTLTGRRLYKNRVRPSIVAPLKPPASYHDQQLVDSTIGHYERNNFAIYLSRLLGTPVANDLLALFQVGTWYDNFSVSAHWGFCDVFWQIDEQGQVHAGKIMYHSRATGKRFKDKNTDAPDRPMWVHEILSMHDFNLEQCLFGLHQLANQPSSKPIAVVESEKTAIIATAFEPGFIWLACGGLGNLTVDKCKPLAGRSITLFPDLGGYQRWNVKAEELRRMGYTVRVSSVLEGRASTLDRHAGLDIADYLTAYRCPQTGRALTESDGYPALWDCLTLQPVPTITQLSVQDYLKKQ